MRSRASVLTLVGALVVGCASVALPPMRPPRVGSVMPQGGAAQAAGLMRQVDALKLRYSQFAEENYLAIACAGSGLLRASSDAFSQVMRGVPFDPAHAAAMGTMGILFSGLLGASWLRHLEGQLGSGTSPTDVVKKSAADFLCYAPCANSAYLFFVPLLTLLYSHGVGDWGSAAEMASTSAQQGFAAAMALELSLFAPYNLLSFRLIPAVYRPQTTAAACAGYTVALSALC